MSGSSSEMQAILQTAVMFGFITCIIYFVFLRTMGTTPAASPAATGTQQQQPNHRGVRQEKSSVPLKTLCTRVPPHLSDASAKITQAGGSNVLSDGVIAFRHSKVASFEASLDSNEQIKNRKERAKVLTHLLASSDGAVSTPPVKGGAIVLAVPFEDIECEKLRRVVYLLATYYNLLLIVSVYSKFQPKSMNDVLHRLRGSADDPSYLAPTILPDHRVTASSSVTGRVAFVRQLQRIDLVLDFDTEVKESLSRFGHRVILYGANHTKEDNDGASRLGAALL